MTLWLCCKLYPCELESVKGECTLHIFTLYNAHTGCTWATKNLTKLKCQYQIHIKQYRAFFPEHKVQKVLCYFNCFCSQSFIFVVFCCCCWNFSRQKRSRISWVLKNMVQNRNFFDDVMFVVCIFCSSFIWFSNK